MSLKNTKHNLDPITLDRGQCHKKARVRRWQQQHVVDALDLIAEEVPVAMVYNGISPVVMMASPADLEDFALGFSLSEGIVQSADEIYEIELFTLSEDLQDGIEIHLSITSQRAFEIKQRRRNLTGRTGCGLCGAESLQQAIRPISPITPSPMPAAENINSAIKALNKHQPLMELTGAFHGAAWCDNEGDIQLVREDVGRHNALDKLIGALVSQGKNLQQGFLLISSRASFEMVQKATYCGISTMVAVSAPTGLALKLAQETGLNLIGFARSGRHVIYTASSSYSE